MNVSRHGLACLLAIAPLLAGGPAHADGTCTTPVVVGVPVTFPANLGVGEVFGTDAAAATAACVSLQGDVFPATLSVWIEFDTGGGNWVPMCTPESVTRFSDLGVLEAHATTTCAYRMSDQAWLAPHRAHATLTDHSTGAVYAATSPEWPGGI